MKRIAHQLACLALVAILPGALVMAEGIRAAPLQSFSPPEGQPPMQLPTAVALGAAGQVYVLDGVNNRIVAFDPDGRVASVIAPSGPYVLNQPVGLRVAADGRLWIADSGNGRLVVCDADGSSAESIALPAPADGRRADPTDLAFVRGGSMAWVVDNDNNRLLRYEITNGTWQSVGGMGEALGLWQYPFQICANASGEIVVSDVINARVQLLRDDGTPLRSLGDFGVELGQLFRPGGIALDAEGRIWVADSVTGVIQVLRRNGTVVDVLRDAADRPVSFASPLGLAFDTGGALYVVESRANRVQKFAISKTNLPSPEPTPLRKRNDSARQSKSCVICHIDWSPPFSEGRDSALLSRPASTPDDPIVARSEICLSCHDGTVADSRRRAWAEHGHKVGVPPSAGMNVPKHLPLAGGKVACRTCHSAHGSGVPEGDLRRAIILRVPNESSELCSACHTDNAHGPHFSVRPVESHLKLPDWFAERGAETGPSGEVTCQSCHAPHGAPFQNLLLADVGASQLCLACHAQTHPQAFAAERFTGHPFNVRASAAQAAVVRDIGTRLGVNDQLVCSSCHSMHRETSDRYLLADRADDRGNCMGCHAGQRDVHGTSHDLRAAFPSERNALGLTTVEGGSCSACHAAHRDSRKPAPGPGDFAGACLSCHQAGGCAENKRLGNLNHPSVSCTECHDPHRAEYGSFLRERADDLCARCHADKMQMAGGPHDSLSHRGAWCDVSDRAGERCLSCHKPHGDAQSGLYRVRSEHSHAAADGVCIACHSAVAPGGASALLHPQTVTPARAEGLPIDHAGGPMQHVGCGACHDPHGAPSDAGALLRAPDGATLCAGCHADVGHIAATAHSPESLAAHGLESAACKPCHQVHGDARTVTSKYLWPRGLLQPGVSPGDEHCVVCHRAEGPAHPPVVASHPPVQMFNLQPTGNGVLPLFDQTGVPAADGTFGCRTCHLPHGRSDSDLLAITPHFPSTRALRLQLRPFEAPNACTLCHSTDALRRFLYFHDPERRGPTSIDR